jgi:hypothetical protein
MRIFSSVGYLLPFIFWDLYRAQTNFLNGSVLCNLDQIFNRLIFFA